ncbi:MAG TPA: hypothetical protein VEV81_15855, partial [Pyrinomonadaceae bacterium]|nr:hypothetical protein [Pyrinomonadaceae bacterium]
KPDKPRNEMKGDETPFDEKYKAGEFIFVEGLVVEGAEKLSYKVDVKTPDANQRAREFADNAFMTIPTLAERQAEAARTWPAFFAAFRSAVKRRDRAALKEMMDPEFQTGDGTNVMQGDPDEAFRLWDDPKILGWEAFDKVLARGAVPVALWQSPGGRPSEDISLIAPPAANVQRNYQRGVVKWYAYFSFREGQWKCTTFTKCCPPAGEHHAPRQRLRP